MKVYVISNPDDQIQALPKLSSDHSYPDQNSHDPVASRPRWTMVLGGLKRKAALFWGAFFWTISAAGVSTEPHPLPPLRWVPTALNGINEELTLTESASLSLSRWCFHRPSFHEHPLKAVRLNAPTKPATKAIRQLLGVGPKTLIRYRRVELTCRGIGLSMADNWYVPERLPGDMNQRLEQSPTPFGLVVQPLAPRRVSLMSRLNRGWILKDLWTERTLSFESARHRSTILEIRALLVTDHGPISLVEEHYASSLLDLAEPSETALELAKPPPQTHKVRQSGVQGTETP